MTQSPANSLVVLDFETTGLSPDKGDRAIEIGAVRIVDGVVTEQFQALMNPGRQVNAFIEEYTGITNEMLLSARSSSDVMNEFCDFIGDDNLLAHNASFDQKFLEHELALIGRSFIGEFSCSLLASRRLLPQAQSHSLGNLVKYLELAGEGNFHRALFDAEMTAKLWLTLLNNIEQNFHISPIPFSLMQQLCCTPKKQIANLLQNYNLQQCSF